MIQVLKDIETFLKANLQAYLDTIATEQSITVDSWKELGIYRQRGQQYPSVSIEPTSTGDLEFVPGNGGVGSMVRRIDNITIVVWHRGNRTTTRIIEENAVAYMDALERLFTEKADMENRAYQLVLIKDTAYTDLFPDTAGQTANVLLKGAAFTIEVRPNYF